MIVDMYGSFCYYDNVDKLGYIGISVYYGEHRLIFWKDDSVWFNEVLVLC